jgi:ribonuclease VapC
VIVDTSALVAVLYEEDHAAELRHAMLSQAASIPAPAVLEFLRVADLRSAGLGAIARDMLEDLVRNGTEIVPFDADHARIAAEANAQFGKGMGQGGKLNLLDLMVYAVAKHRGEPLLCTGKDFAASDALLHPACRPW